MSSTRQLAAIMFTDIVGYTTFMGKDERKAFELLNKNRQLQKPIIEQCNGKWIKELGDGVMASFTTVSEAVNAAIKIQQICNASKEFQLRIGIHLGEVVFENDDVFGDGVNISSRIQAIADPGSIYVSESVYQNISNKKDIRTKYIREESLKNVKDPIRIYQILIEDNQLPTSTPARPISEKSIAILPFTNMSSDPEQEYFSDGITEDIITHISKIHEFKVISRTSVIQYKKTQKSLPQIASELKVFYLLEGSVRKAGNRLRIVTQLIDAKNDEHVWADTYDRELTDVFDIQSEIAERVAIELKAKLSVSEKIRIARKPTENLEAYNFYILGRSHYHKATPEDFTKAIEYYNKALELDPAFALVYAAQAVAILYRGVGYFGIRPHDALPESFRLANKALELDPNLSDAYTARAEVYDWYFFDWDKAEADYQLALKLNPSNATAHLYWAFHLIIHRKLNEAMAEREKAFDLDPHSSLIRMNGILIPMFAGRSEQSLKEMRMAMMLDDSYSNWMVLGWIASQIGLTDESVSSLHEAFKRSNQLTFFKITYIYGLARAGQHQKARALLAEIHELEKKEFVWPMGIAFIYAYLGETEKALTYLEKSYEERVGWMLFIGCDPTLDILRKEPRLKELVRKIGPPEAIAQIDRFD